MIADIAQPWSTDGALQQRLAAFVQNLREPVSQGHRCTYATTPVAAPAEPLRKADSGGWGARQPSLNQARFRSSLSKLKSSIHAINFVNHNRRFYSDGTQRNTVAHGAKQQHGNEGRCSKSMTFLSSRAQHGLEQMYSKLGAWIGRHPKSALWIGTLCLLSGVPGTFFLQGEAHVLWINFDTDMYKNFAIRSHQFYKDYEHVIHMSDGFHHPPRTGVLIMSPAAGRDDTTLSKVFLEDALDILNHVYDDITVDCGGQDYRYDDLCEKNGVGLCASKQGSDLLSAVGHDKERLNMLPAPGANQNEYWAALSGLYQTVSTYATDGFLDVEGGFRLSLAGVPEADLRDRPFTEWHPSAFTVVINLAYQKDARLKKVAEKWEAKVVSYLGSKQRLHSDTVRVTFSMETTVQTEMAESIVGALPMVFTTVAVMILYSTVFLATQVRTKAGKMTQGYLVMQGSLIPTLSGISALGWMYYLGWTVNLLCTFVLFLVLCVGVDCTFIFISAMKAVGPKVKKLDDATSMSLAEAGPAVTLTSLTSICAFFLSAAFSTNMPGMMVFNICMAVALLINVIGFVFFFTAWQVFNEERIAEGLMDFNLFNYNLLPHEPPKFLRKKACPGKIPEWMDVGAKLRHVLNTRYAPLFSGSTLFKVLGTLIMIASLVVSILFIPKIELGIPSTYYASDSSYLQDLYDDLDTHMHGTRPLKVNMVVEHLDLGSPDMLKEFLSLVMVPILARNDTIVTQCFAETYARYVVKLQDATPPTPDTSSGDAMTGDLTGDTASGDTASGDTASGDALGLGSPWQDWRSYLMDRTPTPSGSMPVRLQTFGAYINPILVDGTTSGLPIPKSIGCNIYIAQPIDDAHVRIEQANFFSGLTSDLAWPACTAELCNSTSFYFAAHSFAETVSNEDSVESMIQTTIIVAICAVAVVLVFALPIHRALISACNILLVVVNILGFMGYAKISYSPISFCTLTMAIGFCVDYTVEVQHFSAVGEAGSRMSTKMEHAIKSCGYDVGHGCATAFIGVALISSVPGQAFRLFGFLCMIMCLYGGIYALWCLPALMTLVDDVGRALCNPRLKKPQVHVAPRQIEQPNEDPQVEAAAAQAIQRALQKRNTKSGLLTSPPATSVGLVEMQATLPLVLPMEAARWPSDSGAVRLAPLGPNHLAAKAEAANAEAAMKVARLAVDMAALATARQKAFLATQKPEH